MKHFFIKYTILFYIILLTVVSCSKEPVCKDFKTGEFEYVNKAISYKIFRNDTLQIETHPSSGIEIHNKVVWTSDCTYELTCTEIVNGNENINQLIGHTIFVEITNFSKNTYTSNVKSDFMNKEVELIKVNSI